MGRAPNGPWESSGLGRGGVESRGRGRFVPGGRRPRLAPRTRPPSLSPLCRNGSRSPDRRGSSVGQARCRLTYLVVHRPPLSPLCVPVNVGKG